MKTLYIARHAKSSWKFPDLTDFERPLNKRGKKNAPFMGELLAEKKIKPELIISSPALRAKVTAIAISEKIDYPQEKILFDDEIYEAGLFTLRELISKFSNDYSSIMIFGHNPGFTSLNNYLSNKYIDNIPTCGIVALDLEIDTWADLSERCGKQIFFEYPKKHV